jgi:hypothetical protein
MAGGGKIGDYKINAFAEKPLAGSRPEFPTLHKT